MATPNTLAQRFLDHFNARERDQLLDILASDLRYNGRKEDGTHLLTEWIDRANTTMTPLRWFGSDDLTVVEVDVVWTSASSGETTDHAVWALAFGFADDKIASISRYADVGEAVTKMGLVAESAQPEAGSSMSKPRQTRKKSPKNG
jgi:hypothetical protein